MTSHIRVLPRDVLIDVKEGRSMLSALAGKRLNLYAVCGGKGLCGSCRARVEGDAPAPDEQESKLLTSEELADGWRLLCRLFPRKDSTLTVNLEDTELLSSFALDGPFETQPFGFAIDIGTSKLAVYLVSLSTGQVLSSMAVPNPQSSFGEDLITRLHAAEDSVEADAMKNILVEELNSCFDRLAEGVSFEAMDACEVVAVGNTAMHHLFLGLPISQLCRNPFNPSSSSARDLRARDLGLRVMPTSHIHMPALIGGFVGSDHLAALVASRVFLRGAPTLLVDIGTNTEVTLVSGGRLSCCSCASGPAFEGAGIRYGLRAREGAISRVSVDENERLVVETMGDGPPKGICGSGIVDALACMLRLGSVEASGRLVKGAPGVREEDGDIVFLLAERAGEKPITISQDDVREIQKAKGAIRGGIEMLLERACVKGGDLETIILAGSFGSFIDPASALALGMFPPLPPESFMQAGNAAGMGARVLLCSVEERVRSESLAREVEHVDLASYPGSGYFFAACMTFGEKALQKSLKRFLNATRSQ